MESNFNYQPDGPTLKIGQTVHFVRNLTDPALYVASNVSTDSQGLNTVLLKGNIRAVVCKISREKTNIDGLPGYVRCYTLRFTRRFKAGESQQRLPRTYFIPRVEDKDLPESFKEVVKNIDLIEVCKPMDVVYTRNIMSPFYGYVRCGEVGQVINCKKAVCGLDSEETHWVVDCEASSFGHSEYELGPYLLKVEPETDTRYASVEAWPHHRDYSVGPKRFLH